LGCFHDITAEKAVEQTGIKMLLKKDRAANGLLDVAISYQLQDAPNQPEKKMEVYGRISPREKQVLRLVAAGCSSKQIAAELAISENTVETHRRHLLEKFKVNNSMALVKEAHRRCLV
jgi:DNA-binding CsgD family transcriptional regulator